MDYNSNRHARTLFDGIADRYDLFAEPFSFLQYKRWRRYLVSRFDLGPRDMVMDLCTGTASVAIDVARAFGSRVTGVDLSGEMLRRARSNVGRAGLEENIAMIAGRAESLPFLDARFDAVCFTYLLRYVESPEATLREIVRVLKPGGRLASLEFGVPTNTIARGLWYAYTRGVLPLASGVISPGWREVGTFLGPSICRFYRCHSVGQIQRMWADLGILDVQVKRLSLGGGVVMWGTKSA